MGCDIHLWVEARESEGSPWKLVHPEWQCASCNGRGHYHKRPDDTCYSCQGSGRTKVLSVRNYTLFSMLANVRNEYGLKGPPWRAKIKAQFGDDSSFDIDSDPVPFIAQERGWPADMSEELRGWITRWEAWSEAGGDEDEPTYPEPMASVGDYDASWVTVREVLDYLERHHRRIERGFVPIEHWRGWPDNFYAASNDGGEVSYCKGIGGAGVKVLAPDQANAVLAVSEVVQRHVYVRAAWEVEVNRQISKNFTEHFLPACLKLARPENLRLVFNFDS